MISGSSTSGSPRSSSSRPWHVWTGGVTVRSWLPSWRAYSRDGRSPLSAPSEQWGVGVSVCVVCLVGLRPGRAAMHVRLATALVPGRELGGVGSIGVAGQTLALPWCLSEGLSLACHCQDPSAFPTRHWVRTLEIDLVCVMHVLDGIWVPPSLWTTGLEIESGWCSGPLRLLESVGCVGRGLRCRRRQDLVYKIVTSITCVRRPLYILPL